MKNFQNRGLLMTKNEYGEVLKAERIKREISIRQLAEMAGVNKTTIQRIESGEVSPSVDVFERILAAMSMGLKIVTASD